MGQEDRRYGSSNAVRWKGGGGGEVLTGPGQSPVPPLRWWGLHGGGGMAAVGAGHWQGSIAEGKGHATHAAPFVLVPHTPHVPWTSTPQAPYPF